MRVKLDHSIGAALIAVAGLPFLPRPLSASWPFIVASTVFQIAYFVLVARTYRVADMSLAYPLMRGSAPLLVALASVTLMGEPLSQSAWFGVGTICVGILSMASAARQASEAGVALSLGNAIVIAGYTLIDGIGVRRSEAPSSYTLWIFLLTGLLLGGWTLATRHRAFLHYGRQNWQLGSVGGAGTIGSYGLALWAMTVAPVAVVAALRGTSILFGVAVAALFLRERVGTAKVVGVFIIAIGAAALRLS
ncbi:EamA family transporter [Ancylobacter pratisalsi]|uniref:EamA family transporter n=1 Tax=Ancylobacter pratisalsi TaxID=1745854 RepID=A0A6P1YXP4_9HYPH|nr:EamA family transporter [Ancylobacter pratisalsi]